MSKSRKKAQSELPLKGEGISQDVIDKAQKIVELLKPITSLSVVGEFLKPKELPHSASSWEEMWEKRLLPGLRNRKVEVAELGQLLAEAEEFGRSHVFLYTAKRKEIEKYLDRARIEKLCEKEGLGSVLTDVVVENLPARPAITQIREEMVAEQRAWVFKIVETREERRFLRETLLEGDRISKEYQVFRTRAVNVVRLHESGLLELRMQSHVNSTQYRADITRLWTQLQNFVPPGPFTEFSLRKARDQFWDKRKSLKHKIRFSDSTLRNKFGTTLVASTGADTADLFDDSGAAASIDQFRGHGAHCDSSNIWFRPVDGLFNREIHVLLSGLSNEFAVTASCTRAEYEYVLNELRAHN